MSGLHGAYDMGHTVAGWTGTTIALIGCAGAGAALCAAWPLGIGLGLAVVAVGGLVTWVLHLTGWGKPSGPRPADQWDWRVKDPMTGHADCLGCRLAGRRTPASPRAGGPVGEAGQPGSRPEPSAASAAAPSAASAPSAPSAASV
ncbi:MAG TPA: HGxxPAAW family protein [Streptomyces sp.]|uniref:HGxxPAAW family protein n=1 Tax=Streptomyces sp. TaxID=1931 RepID=UPI002D6B9FD7|nr:HGxxPAAW family protein [Streptomyces sp.]HZG02272.1 HGxxPAAW family protein [Streptomyces sp.]